MNEWHQAAFHLIAPFLKPVMPLLRDPTVSEVMINSDAVFVEREGRLERVPGVLPKPIQIRRAVLAIARQLGDNISEQQPLLDARLPDGSRIAAALPPCSFGGPVLTIRKFSKNRLYLEDLVASNTLTPSLATAIRQAVTTRQNLMISGGTGTGKTTLLAAITKLIPEDERILVIEDTVELPLEKPNLVRFATRRASPGLPEVSIQDLVKAALRHRPDRIVLGEIRGQEAWDLLQALNTGHRGSLTTLHANSAAHALKRCASCVMQSGIGLPFTAVQELVAEAIDLVLHMDRCNGKRKVTGALLVTGYEFKTQQWQYQEIE